MSNLSVCLFGRERYPYKLSFNPFSNLNTMRQYVVKIKVVTFLNVISDFIQMKFENAFINITKSLTPTDCEKSENIRVRKNNFVTRDQRILRKGFILP